MNNYAEIIINRNSPAVDRVFTYAVPLELQQNICLGQLVQVPFNRELLEGVVVGLPQQVQADFALREISQILGEKPLFSEEMLALSSWMSSYYLCSRAKALQAMLPAAMHISGKLPKSASVRVYSLAADWQQVRSSAKRSQLVQLLQQAGPQTEHQLAEKGFLRAFLRAQVEAGLLVEQVRRLDAAGNLHSTAPTELNEEQQQVYAAFMQERSGKNRPFLLHGITGSGKTELYLRLIREMIRQGKGSIVLVPEIALSSQMVEMLSLRLPQPPLVLHSALLPAERRQIWQDVAEGRVQCVVGARSAVFAPFANLGLIIIDEAHESSYKQDNTPRFSALQVAEKRCELSQASLLLGSATPLVEQYYAAAMGRYAFGRLQHRYHAAPLPEVEVVDMRDELKLGNKSIFSYALQQGLQQVVAQGEQAVLLLNRRGFYQHFSCRDCGQSITCPHCAVAMSFHLKGQSGQLKCHYCGRILPAPQLCPLCGSKSIRRFGVGTQRVADEVQRLLPEARVARLDSDVIQQRGAHERIYAAMKQGEYDVLVGTQMVAKGLDFPNLTLAAVVAADSQLNLPDWRAGERVFQMITQLIGRAGRRDKQGLALIQTYCPEAMPIAAAAEGDYEAFYQAELQNRYLHAYPPFTQLIRVLLTAADRIELAQAARWLADELHQLLPATDEVCGPAEAPLSRLKDRHRWQLIIKLGSADGQGSAAVAAAEQALRSKYNLPRDLLISVDVDPFSVM